MLTHLLEGEAGCAFARARGAVAVVVDALRASATAAALLEAGATAVLAVREVGEALAVKAAWPDALLYGERGGLPPAGFDHGNSPAEAPAARGRRVIFTTTTGAGRMVQCRGARAALMGGPMNASAVCRAAATLAGKDGEVAIISAGLMDEPGYDAQEDRAAAVFLAGRLLGTPGLGAVLGEGRDMHETYTPLLESRGLERLFADAPHAENLRRIGRESDIALCAQVDVFSAAPMAVEDLPQGVLLTAFGLGMETTGGNG